MACSPLPIPAQNVKTLFNIGKASPLSEQDPMSLLRTSYESYNCPGTFSLVCGPVGMQLLTVNTYVDLYRYLSNYLPVGATHFPCSAGKAFLLDSTFWLSVFCISAFSTLLNDRESYLAFLNASS